MNYSDAERSIKDLRNGNLDAQGLGRLLSFMLDALKDIEGVRR